MNKHLIDKYLSQLKDEEKIALNIAKSYLESSFDLEKTIGFLQFKKMYHSSLV